jgi:hypothetical protein
LEGTVKLVMDTQTFASGFSKREFVVTTDDGKFPQDIKLECIKEKADLLNDLQEGDSVKVSFDLRGNEYKDRYFVNLQAWRVEKQDATAPAAGPPPAGDDDRPPLPSDDVAPDDDDLPF